MYILAIETTGPKGSVAVIDGEGTVTMRVSGEEMNHLKDLMPMAQQILTERGIAKADLSAVAASIGPGSFTGIRIGVASARAIAPVSYTHLFIVSAKRIFSAAWFLISISARQIA